MRRRRATHALDHEPRALPGGECAPERVDDGDGVLALEVTVGVEHEQDDELTVLDAKHRAPLAAAPARSPNNRRDSYHRDRSHL